MIYFTADTHFGHYNVIRFCDRPFASAEEMDEAMIQNWNDRVTGNDTVYILGDMFFRSTNAEGILKRLKGKKRLIVGNHDGSWMTKFDYARYFFQRGQVFGNLGRKALFNAMPLPDAFVEAREAVIYDPRAYS